MLIFISLLPLSESDKYRREGERLPFRPRRLLVQLQQPHFSLPEERGGLACTTARWNNRTDWDEKTLSVAVWNVNADNRDFLLKHTEHLILVRVLFARRGSTEGGVLSEWLIGR